MKNYKIQLEDGDVQFFKQLMDKLGFTNYEEIKEVSEPRIYRAGNFEIHGKNKETEKKEDEPTKEKSTQTTKEPKRIRKDAMTDIKDIMAQIEQRRNRSR